MLTTKSVPAARSMPLDTRKSHASFARAAGSFVPKLTTKVFERYGFHSAEIMTSWAAVAGADIAAVTTPERIKWPRGAANRIAGDDDAAVKGATLVLGVDPAHALDIEYRTTEIADRINRYFGYRAIAAITILQSPGLRSQLQQPKRANAAPIAPIDPPPSLAAIDDERLKAALSILWVGVASEARGR